MELCLFIFILSFILFISSIIILKNAFAMKKEVLEQLDSINSNSDTFIDFFK